MIEPRRIFLAEPPTEHEAGVAYLKSLHVDDVPYVLATDYDEAIKALREMTKSYAELVKYDSGGYWEPEEEEGVIAARAIIAKSETTS